MRIITVLGIIMWSVWLDEKFGVTRKVRNWYWDNKNKKFKVWEGGNK